MPKWYELFKDVVREYDFISISILGITRTGKTNIAKLFVRDFTYGWGNEAVAYYIQGNYIESLDTIFKKEKRSKHKVVAIVLDDMSYSDEARERELAFRLARIKHLLPHAQKIMTIAIYHYLTSVMPFVRLTMIRIITSLMTMYEIDQLKAYFNLDALHDFYELKTSNPIGNRFKALINILGYHEIVEPPKYSFKEEPWKRVKLKATKLLEETIKVYIKLPFTTRSVVRKESAIYFKSPDGKRYYVRVTKVVKAKNIEKEAKVKNTEFIVITPRREHA